MPSSFGFMRNTGTVPTVARGLILGACSVLAVCCLASATTPHSNVALLLALFLLGPLSLVLDLQSPRTKHRWLYLLETFARMSCMGILATALQDPIGWVVVSLAIAMHAPTLWMHTNYQDVARRHDKWVAAALAVAFWTIALLLVLYLSENHVGLEPGVLVWIFSTIMLVCVGAGRCNLWYSLRKPLAPSQHVQVWPALARRQFERCWVELYLYFQRHKDVDAALRTLPLPTLLQWFDHETKFKQHQGVKSTVLEQFGEMVKMAINEKEPRAIVVWPLYSNEEAAKCIGQMNASSSSEPMDTLEIPA